MKSLPQILRMGLIFGFVLLAMEGRPAAAQPDASRGWQVTLDDDQYVWNVGLVELAGDTLVVRQADSLVRTPVARIRELRRFNKTTMEVGNERESAMRALTDSGDEVYDLAGLDPAQRRSAIEKILAQASP